MTAPEHPSTRVARTASRALTIAKGWKIPKDANIGWFDHTFGRMRHVDLTWGEVEALAASALTQAADVKPKKNGRVAIGRFRFRKRTVLKRARRKAPERVTKRE